MSYESTVSVVQFKRFFLRIMTGTMWLSSAAGSGSLAESAAVSGSFAEPGYAPEETVLFVDPVDEVTIFLQSFSIHVLSFDECFPLLENFSRSYFCSFKFTFFH